MPPASARWATSICSFARTPRRPPPDCWRAAATASITPTAAIRCFGRSAARSRLQTGWASTSTIRSRSKCTRGSRSALPAIETDITSLLFPANARPGLNDYPSAASLMMHLSLHAAGNMRARALRLVQLHDIALLAAQFRADDWEELLAARFEDHGPWWAFAPMMLTARYYPTAVPPARTRATRHRLSEPLEKTHATSRTGRCFLVQCSCRSVSGLGVVANARRGAPVHEKQILAEPRCLERAEGGGRSDPGCFRGPLVRTVARQAHLAMDLHATAPGTDAAQRPCGVIARSLTI